MERLQQLLQLNSWLLADMPQYQWQARQFATDEQSQWQLFRSLVNVREPRPVRDDFIKLQDAFLQHKIAEKGITNICDLIPMKERLYLWQGDITTLQVGAIVNAANRGMTW